MLEPNDPKVQELLENQEAFQKLKEKFKTKYANKNISEEELKKQILNEMLTNEDCKKEIEKEMLDFFQNTTKDGKLLAKIGKKNSK